MANSLFLATIIRIGLVVVSYGCKVPAGIFVPSMAIGATFGRMVGIIVKAMYRCVHNDALGRMTALTRCIGHIRIRGSLRFVIRMYLVSRLGRMPSWGQLLLSGKCYPFLRL